VNVLRVILALLTPQERRRGLLVLLIAVVMALVDTVGVASIMPFLAVLGNPGIVETNAYLGALYRFGGFASRDDFLFALGVAALAIVLVAALTRAAGQYAMLRFANMRRYALSRRLLKGYLGQPYAFFLNRNTADLKKRMLSDIDTAVDACLTTLVQMVAVGLVAVLLVALLIAVDPLIAAIVLAIVGGFYTAVYIVNRQLIGRLGRDRSLANRQRFTVAAEALGGIKEVKLFGREAAFDARFAGPALRFARHKATADAISLLPRYLIEAIAFGGALALALVLMRTLQDLGAVLPILGLYAFAGYRLLPAAQQLYAGVTRLRFGLPMAHTVVEDLLACQSSGALLDTGPALPLRESIRFEHVTFRYPGAALPALDRLQLEIRSGMSVGIVGKTGAGKTTVVDLLLGLLEPTEGHILIDGVPLNDANRRNWQRSIGYVPQSIFLADASVAANIAFGIAPEAIDAEAVERAARIANVHDFVAGELPSGYDTVIGERGVRLSGGQRQRVGIARALYHDPPVLVFDEATSALDNTTETAVMEAVSRLRQDRTIIIIAHRLTSVRDCDEIILLEHGKVDRGTFDELVNTSEPFRAMVNSRG
jgi:ATP-binding cassette, subfamily B, bacterial PglK